MFILGKCQPAGRYLKSTGRLLFPLFAIFLRSSSFFFLPPASENSNKRHAVTQMRSSAVTRHARELFSNSGSDKEEKEEKKILQQEQFSPSIPAQIPPGWSDDWKSSTNLVVEQTCKMSQKKVLITRSGVIKTVKKKNSSCLCL